MPEGYTEYYCVCQDCGARFTTTVKADADDNLCPDCREKRERQEAEEDWV